MTGGSFILIYTKCYRVVYWHRILISNNILTCQHIFYFSDFTVKLVDLESRKEQALQEHSAPVLSVAFHPDKKLVVRYIPDKINIMWGIVDYTLTMVLDIRIITIICFLSGFLFM